MTVIYGETSFLLQLALKQKGVDDCKRIVELAESRAVRLVIPALAFFESAYKLRGSKQKRRSQSEEWFQLSLELQRTTHAEHAEASRKLDETKAALARIAEQEREWLAAVVKQLAGCTEIIPLQLEMLNVAYDKYERMGLETADALMIAAIAHHASNDGSLTPAQVSERCFLALDRDFSEPQVKEEFKQLGLKVFKDTGHLRQSLDRQPIKSDQQ
jgi:predicted nucleic acid-binding protein